MQNNTRLRASVVILAAALAATSAAIAAPSQAAPGTGQTSTISGVLKSPDGSPAVGESITYDNYVCDTGEDISHEEDYADATTDASGAFSFPAYASQCYSLYHTGGFIDNGVVAHARIAAAGTTNLSATLASAIDLELTVTGVPAGTNVSVANVLGSGDVQAWTPLSTDATDAAGKVTLTTYHSSRYALVIERSDDVYYQYIGVPIGEPSLSGGAGTFTAPATGASFTQTVTPLRSSPVNLTITGADVGATVQANNWGSLQNDTFGSAEATTEAASITLRGLTPGQTDISVSGDSGATHVFGEARDVAVTNDVSAPVSVSIAAIPSDKSLADAGDVLMSTSGTMQIGSQLAAHPTFTGSAAHFAGLPTTEISTYWLSANHATPSQFLKLRGQGSTWTIQDDLATNHVLFALSVIRVPGYDPIYVDAIAWVSDPLRILLGADPIFPTGPIQAGVAPFPSVVPSVAGNAVVGQTLTASPGIWTSSPSGFTYQWTRNGIAITGATGQTLKLTGADVGARIAVTVTPVKAGHAVMPMTSAPTGPVVQAASKTTPQGTAKAVAKVTATVKKKGQVKRGKKATVSVKVTAPGITPTGKVTVKFGKKKITKNLGKNGTVKIKSPKLKKKGKVKVKVTYAGDSAVAPAKLKPKQAKKLTLKVK